MNESNKEYIQSLENLLIFMCATYYEIEKVLLKNKSDLLLKFPKIQGSSINFKLQDIGKLDFEQPKMELKEVYKQIKLNKEGE